MYLCMYVCMCKCGSILMMRERRKGGVHDDDDDDDDVGLTIKSVNLSTCPDVLSTTSGVKQVHSIYQHDDMRQTDRHRERGERVATYISE